MRLSVFLLFVFCVTLNSIEAQYSYKWEKEGLTVKTSENFVKEESPYTMMLRSSDLEIYISLLGGMEGVDGLEGSLDSYAKSFEYQTNERASGFKGDDVMQIAALSAQKEGSMILLALIANNSFTKHYIYEAKYKEKDKKLVYEVLGNITLGITGEKPVNSEPVQPIDTEDDEVVDNDIVLNEKALDFTLKGVDEEEYSLSMFKGKVVLLDFWGTWCRPCIEAIPKLKRLYSKYKNSDFEIISVANDNNVEKWKSVVAKQGMEWFNLIDENGKVSKRYKIKAYPTMMLIDKKGNLLQKDANIYSIEEYLKSEGIKPENNINNSEIKTHNISKPEKRTWELLKKYSKDGYLILKGYYEAPNEYSGITLGEDSDFTQWIDGNTEKEIVSAISTVVHEICHGYTSKIYLKVFKDKGQPISGFDYSAFYIENNQTEVVKHTEVYVTKKMNSIFPKELITSRYETYVYPSEPIMGSQQSGIYGLLDEFNAYYQGTKVSIEMFDYYKENKNTPSGWLNYLSDFYGQYYSFLEFKAYILSYALYAKKYEPKVYAGIINNKELLYVLKRTDENWNKLIEDFKKKRSELFQLLKSEGHKVSEDNEFTFIDSNGVGNFKNVYHKLQKGLSGSEFDKIARILGLNSSSGEDI